MVLGVGVSVLALLIGPVVTFPQTTADVDQKREILLESEMDYDILVANITVTEKAYSTINGAFCNVHVTQPAANTRTMYCNQKKGELNARDSDLKAQAQKLLFTINQLKLQLSTPQPVR